MATPSTLYWEDIDIGQELETGLLDIDAPGIRCFTESSTRSLITLTATPPKRPCSEGYALVAGMFQR